MTSLSQRMNLDSGEKTWLTPPHIIEKLGPFDLDPCCPDEMPWPTASDMVTKDRDGLSVDWSGKRVWLNPPYGRESYPFLRRMARHSGGGIAFLFARTDTKAWQKYIFPAAYGILFISGRVNFYQKDGSIGKRSPAPSALVAYSAQDFFRLSVCGIEGTLVCLKYVLR